MEVWFLRHGQTAWNREHRIQGSTAEIDIDEEGVRQAEAARDSIVSAGIAFDRLFASPYRRALHTAEIIGGGLGLVPEADGRLREISFGPYEGTRYGHGLFKDSNIRACFVDPPRYEPPPGAESFADVDARLRAFFRETLAPLEGRARRVLAVAHGGVLRTVLRIASSIPLADFWVGSQPNCCAHILEFAGGTATLKARAVREWPVSLP